MPRLRSTWQLKALIGVSVLSVQECIHCAVVQPLLAGNMETHAPNRGSGLYMQRYTVLGNMFYYVQACAPVWGRM